jgi:hypothetical protein
MVRHARDGEPMHLHCKAAGRKPNLVLINSAGVAGRGKRYTFPHHVFEDAVLSCLREVNPADVLPPESKGPSRAGLLRARLAEARRQAEQVTAELKNGFSKGLAALLRQQEALEEATAQELQEELARTTRPAERCWNEFGSLVDVLTGAKDPDATRLRLRTLLRGMVDEVWLLTVRRGRTILAAAQVYFQGGAAWRDYLITYRAATNTVRGGWSVRSFSRDALPGDLDLRKADHVARLEQALLDLDPAILKNL